MSVRRLEVLEVAKRAGFSLDEARPLLHSADAGTPAFEALRELAQRMLPDIEALIARAREQRSWMLTATDCSCTSLDVCALFEPAADRPLPSEPLHVTRIAKRRARHPVRSRRGAGSTAERRRTAWPT